MSTLTNQSYKSYSYVSRYSKFPYYYNVEDNKYIYGITNYLDNTTVYTLHTIKQGDTLDSIALKYYSNPTLYWVICSYNRIQNPYVNLTPGKTIKVPVLSNIRFDDTIRG